MHRTCLIVLLLILITPTIISQASATGNSIFNVSTTSTESLSPSTTEWWNLNWRYKMSVTATNPAITSRANETIFVYLDIPQGRCLNGFRELRVIDENGVEVPSAVVYELPQDGFTRGAFLLFLANFDAMETRTFHVYYGNPTAAPPSYRSSQPLTSIDSNIIKIDLNEADVNLGYRKEPYTYLYTSKIRYDSSTQHDYGSISIAYNPLTLLRDWETPFNLTATRINATVSIYKAGELTLVKTFLLQSNQLWIYDVLINEGPNLIDATYIDFFNAVAMSMRGLVHGGYNLDDNVLFAEVGGTFIGLKSNVYPNAYDVGFWRTIYNRTRNVELAMASEGYGDLALAVQWNVGELRRYEHKTLVRLFTTSANYMGLRDSLNHVTTMPQISFLNEETLESPIPSVVVIATDEVQRTNLTVPLQGFTTYYNISEAGWTVNSAWIKGDTEYGLPGKGDYDFEKPTLWEIRRRAGSGCIAFPTAYTWSEERKSYVGAVRLWDNSTNDYAWGNVTTRFISVVGASRTIFSFKYRAGYHSYNGTLPRLYIALMVDTDFDEVNDKTLTFPLQETFTGLNETKVSELIGDNQWHSVRVDVTNFVAAKNFQFSIKLYGETYGYDGSKMNFRGLLEIDVDDVFIEVYGSGPDIFDFKIDSFSNNATITYSDPGLNTLLFSTANVTIYYQVVKSIPTLSAEQKGILKAIFQIKEKKSLTLAQHAAVIHGVRGALLKAVYLNDSLLKEDHYDLNEPCLIINKEAFLSTLGTDKLTTFKLHLSNTYHTVTIHAQDDNGKPLTNASITAEDHYGRKIIQSTTDITGTATLDLIPFTYVINTAYHGTNLDSKTIKLKADSELTSSCRVYELRFRVFNLLNQLVWGARVQLMKDGGAVIEEGSTNEEGIITFKLVALSRYTIQVLIEEKLHLQTEFKPTLNNITIDLRTSYTPMWFIAAILASLIAVITLILFLAKHAGKIFISKT